MKKWMGCLLALCLAVMPLALGLAEGTIGYRGATQKAEPAPTPIGYHGLQAKSAPTPIGWRGVPAAPVRPAATAAPVPTPAPVVIDLSAVQEAFIIGFEARWMGSEPVVFFEPTVYEDSMFQEVAVGTVDDRLYLDLSLFVDEDMYWLFITQLDDTPDLQLISRVTAVAIAARLDLDDAALAVVEQEIIALAECVKEEAEAEEGAYAFDYLDYGDWYACIGYDAEYEQFDAMAELQ